MRLPEGLDSVPGLRLAPHLGRETNVTSCENVPVSSSSATRVAIAQTAPVYGDKAASLEKAFEQNRFRALIPRSESAIHH